MARRAEAGEQLAMRHAARRQRLGEFDVRRPCGEDRAQARERKFPNLWHAFAVRQHQVGRTFRPGRTCRQVVELDERWNHVHLERIHRAQKRGDKIADRDIVIELAVEQGEGLEILHVAQLEPRQAPAELVRRKTRIDDQDVVVGDLALHRFARHQRQAERVVLDAVIGRLVGHLHGDGGNAEVALEDDAEVIGHVGAAVRQIGTDDVGATEAANRHERTDGGGDSGARYGLRSKSCAPRRSRTFAAGRGAAMGAAVGTIDAAAGRAVAGGAGGGTVATGCAGSPRSKPPMALRPLRPSCAYTLTRAAPAGTASANCASRAWYHRELNTRPSASSQSTATSPPKSPAGTRTSTCGFQRSPPRAKRSCASGRASTSAGSPSRLYVSTNTRSSMCALLATIASPIGVPGVSSRSISGLEYAGLGQLVHDAAKTATAPLSGSRRNRSPIESSVGWSNGAEKQVIASTMG